MANITPTVQTMGGPVGQPAPIVVATWGPMANGDVGLPLGVTVGPNVGIYADISVQVFGTFGTGGSVAFEGSNDGTHWAALHNPGETTIAITSAGIQAVLENTLYTRPDVTAGDGNTTLTVVAMYRRAI